jgi:hypothetical protein
MNDNGPRGALGGPMGSGMRAGPMDYYIDMLFRPTGPVPGGTANGTTTGQAMTGTATETTDLGPVRNEIGRIVASSFKDGQITLSQTDHAYIGALIAQRTGLSQQDAEKRLDEVIGQAKAAMDDVANKAKQAADDARKAGAALALWTFVSMLIGAFVASYAATIGGRHRDL